MSFEQSLVLGNVTSNGLGCTGWRGVIGCLKLKVIVRKRATNYRALLRQMTCKDMASYDSKPPCSLWGDADADL